MPTRDYWIRQAEKALDRVRQLDRYGEDDWEDGVVIRFDYQFQGHGTVYSYAAIKSNGLWYSTGPRAPKAYKWDELTSWFAEAANEVEVKVVTEYCDIDDPYFDR